MKHLKKKFIQRIEVGQDIVNLIKSIPADNDKIKGIKESNLEGYYSIAFTEDNNLFQTFKYKQNDHLYLIPEPNPIVIYFDTARFFYKELKEQRKKLFEGQTSFDNNINALNVSFYRYYSAACSFSIFLFTAIEAFVNKIIPVDFEYRKTIQDKKVELYNKHQIQRNIDTI